MNFPSLCIFKHIDVEDQMGRQLISDNQTLPQESIFLSVPNDVKFGVSVADRALTNGPQFSSAVFHCEFFASCTLVSV